MLEIDPFWGKAYFWEEKHEGKKGKMEGKTTRAKKG
jgi:hypothetical protein